MFSFFHQALVYFHTFSFFQNSRKPLCSSHSPKMRRIPDLASGQTSRSAGPHFLFPPNQPCGARSGSILLVCLQLLMKARKTKTNLWQKPEPTRRPGFLTGPSPAKLVIFTICRDPPTRAGTGPQRRHRARQEVQGFPSALSSRYWCR